MVRVIAFRHVPFEGAGRIETVLAARGIALEYADLYLPGAPVPDLATAAGVVILGGPMSVNDDLPWLRLEERLIGEALGRRQPVLGVCLGSQLIAKILGAQVYKNHRKEIGWFEIRLSGDGEQDRLFSGLSPVETVFHWHGETYDLPPGAVLLASSEACWHQAYRMGDSVYGLQFHLEVTPDMIADWCTHEENCGDVRELSAPLDPYRNQARGTELADVVFGHWCDLLHENSVV
jgi:GMP synthase-like glutamine amidotransferase